MRLARLARDAVHLGLRRQLGVVLRQLQQAALGPALGRAHRDPGAAPLAEHGAEHGAVLERRHDLRRDRPSPPSSTRAGTPRARRRPRAPPRSPGRTTAGPPRRRRAPGTPGCWRRGRPARARPRRTRRARRRGWTGARARGARRRACRAAAPPSRTPGARAAAFISRSMSFSTSPRRPRRKSTAWFTVAMYSSCVQRSSHGPSERLMKYCRQGEPLGRPGSPPLHLRYGKMRPMSSSVSRTFLALENGPKYRLPGHAAAAEEADARPLVVQRDLDGRVALVVAQAEVVGRALLLDEVVLQEERLRLRGRRHPVDVPGLREHLAGAPVRLRRRAQVVGHALAQRLRLAHVQHRPVGAEEAVHAGLVGDALEGLAEVVEVIATLGLLGHHPDCTAVPGATLADGRRRGRRRYDAC